jgi:predicted dehydrogenase
MPSPVRIVLIGAGRAGRVHANSLVNHVSGGVLVGLVDSVQDTLRETGEMYGIDARFASLEEALSKLDFDAAVISTPTFTHKSLTVMAAEAGKHVFVEKPMALTLQECDAMIEAASKNSVFLQIGFMRRFSPEFVDAAQRINADEIGQPMMIKSLTHGPGLPPLWARDLKTSNGMLAEVNSHDWDCTRWLMGSNPERVYVEVANFKGASRGVDTPNFYDNVLVNIRFENGGLGSISGICPCDYGYDARVEIVGERGIMQIGQMQGLPVVVCTNRDDGLRSPIYRTWPERFAWGYIREMEHFVNSILTDTPPQVVGQDGRWAVAAVLAGTRSFLEERPVYLREVLETATV